MPAETLLSTMLPTVTLLPLKKSSLPSVINKVALLPIWSGPLRLRLAVSPLRQSVLAEPAQVRSVPKAGSAMRTALHTPQKPIGVVCSSLFPKLARGEELKDLQFILVNALYK